VNKHERQEYVTKRAREMAQSGEYPSWNIIESILIRDGYSEARGWLDDSLIRAELNQLCKLSRKDK
jgi:hypothetical protein